MLFGKTEKALVLLMAIEVAKHVCNCSSFFEGNITFKHNLL
jgi:hypothetical protein